MKKLIIKLLVFAGSFVFGMFLANVAMANEPERGDKGILWKIEGKGIKTSYLLGTFHLIGKSDFDLSEKAKELLSQSDQLVLELDMDDPSMQSQMFQHAGMQGDYSLKALLSDEEYKLVNTEVQKLLGTGLAPFDKMKPFVVTSMLYPSLIDEEVASYELTLIQLAAEQKKEVLGLETVAFQMSVFDKIPYEQQADELVELIVEREKMAKLFKGMVNAYKDGDISALQKEVLDYYEDPSYSKWLLDDRNADWIPKIQKLSADKSNFYAVGAGHLGGEKGVINLLRKAGYKVTALEE